MANILRKDPFGSGIKLQESHKKPIYCLDWSLDLYRDKVVLEEEDEEEEEDPVVDNENNNDDNHKDNKKDAGENGDTVAMDQDKPDGMDVEMELVDTDEEEEEKGGTKPSLRSKKSNPQKTQKGTKQQQQQEENGSYRVLATCAARYVNVYQVSIQRRNAPLVLIQSYIDADPKESFHTCTFAGRCVMLDQDEQLQEDNNQHSLLPGRRQVTLRDEDSRRPVKSHRTSNDDNDNNDNDSPSTTSHVWPLLGETGTGPQFLCVAGDRCTIKVIDTLRQRLAATLVAHGDEIYDLQMCPTDEFILCSASKDNTVRLWNLKTGAQVAVLCGHEGHLDDVVSVSWHSSGDLIASGSMDATVKLWDVSSGTPVRRAIRKSHEAATLLVEKGMQYNERTVNQYVPIFSAEKLHFYCVDCVKFLGDCLLSRSQEDNIVLWEPVLDGSYSMGTSQLKLPHPVANQVKHLRTFGLKESQYWFIRFAIDRAGKTLACGNISGDICVWRIGDKSKSPLKHMDGKRNEAIRCISFSPDDDIMAAATDKGEVWKWDVRREKLAPS